MVHIYIHYPNKKEALKISKLLLEERLVGCVSFVEQSDLYWWQEKLVSTKGVVTFVAAPKKNYTQVETLVKKHHSYKVPCILELPVGRAFKPYKKWLYAETKRRRKNRKS